MDALTGLWFGLPEQMRDPVLFAIPFFLLLLILEWTAARKLARTESAKTGTPRPPSGAYLTRDSWASISMGLVSVATSAGWKALALLGYAAIYVYLAPWHLPVNRWYTWVIALLGVDLLYYGYHRIAHRVPHLLGQPEPESGERIHTDRLRRVAHHVRDYGTAGQWVHTLRR